ncbi:MAG: hypothetical protein AAGA60_15725 [Cyanobacteria bacterium P01_E01_bin.42]
MSIVTALPALRHRGEWGFTIAIALGNLAVLPIRTLEKIHRILSKQSSVKTRSFSNAKPKT